MTTPRLGVGAVLLDEAGRILLILRRKHPEANTWSIPGGKLELYETLEEATAREVEEEIGLRVQVDRLLCMAETIDPELGEHWVSAIYCCHVTSGTPVNREPESIGGVQWFALDEVPENVACFTVPALEELRRETRARR